MKTVGLDDPPGQQYQKYLLNRLTASSQFLNFLHEAQARDDEDMKHIFHKIMIHKWTDEGKRLFAVLGEYYSCEFFPMRFTQDEHFSCLYTDSLTLIQKIINQEFIFPFERNMYNIDVMFHDKTSTDLFGARVTAEQLISGVVSRRFSNSFELDLSNFINDPELREKQIHVHSLGQLVAYKRLMLRMGRDTKLINLSNNHLSIVPQEIMNFFMRGDLVGVNLSNNDIVSLEKLPRMSSLLERLWLEGNPLCEDLDAFTYVKRIAVMFPRLQELDGVAINRHGFAYPFVQNYLYESLQGAKQLTEKFITLFFSHYDSSPRAAMIGFYHPTDTVTLSISTSLTVDQLNDSKHFRTFSRNLAPRETAAAPCPAVSVTPGSPAGAPRKRLYPRSQIVQIFKQLPETQHDPSTFTIDVLRYSKTELLLCVDGVFKERREEGSMSQLRMYQFRRTFYITGHQGQYHIRNEMLHVTAASDHIIQNAFNKPIRKLNELSLVSPTPEHVHVVSTTFRHLTRLNNKEVERRLKVQSWDLRKALLAFQDELKNNRIASDLFVNPSLEDVSDDEID